MKDKPHYIPARDVRINDVIRMELIQGGMIVCYVDKIVPLAGHISFTHNGQRPYYSKAYKPDTRIDVLSR